MSRLKITRRTILRGGIAGTAVGFALPPLEAMRQRSDGTYELDFGGVASPVVADHVVLCLPFTTLRDVDLTEAGFDAKRIPAGPDVHRRARRPGLGMRPVVHQQPVVQVDTLSLVCAAAQVPAAGLVEVQVAVPARAPVLRRQARIGRRGRLAWESAIAGSLAERRGDASWYRRHVCDICGRDSFSGRSWLDSWVDDPWVKAPTRRSCPGNGRASSVTWGCRRATCTSPASTRQRAARATSTVVSRPACARPER